MKEIKDIELDEAIEENKEKMLFSLWNIPLEEKVSYLLECKRDGIRLNKFIHYILKKYIEKDDRVLELLYDYVKYKDSLKKKNKEKVKILKNYHSVIKEYEKIYHPSEDDIEIDIDQTIYNNSQDKSGEIE